MLTRRQAAALRFLAQFLADHGHGPTFDQIALGIGLRSKSGIAVLVAGLEERGFVRRHRKRARALEVLRLPDGEPLPRLATVTRVVRAIGFERVAGGAVLVLHAIDGPAGYRLPDAVVESLRVAIERAPAGDLAAAHELAGLSDLSGAAA
ncbi:MAG: LexA family protein [Alphaproteobacteria bacterium]